MARSTKAPLDEPLLPPRFLFRLAVPCRRLEPLPPPGKPPLGEEFRLPDFSPLDQSPTFAEVRMAWSTQGLALSVRVEGKRRPPRCDENQLESSDGLHVWIDTRDTRTVHRAHRFCHRFVFLQYGGGRRRDQPVAEHLLIHRAREHPRLVRSGELPVAAEKRVDGYVLHAVIRASALTGFDPQEQPRLGFTYLVHDSELGSQSLSCSPRLPMAEDPSLWATLELTS